MRFWRAKARTPQRRRRSAARSSGRRRHTPLRELALHDLPGLVAGKLVDEEDLARDLVTGEVGPHVRAKLLIGGLRAFVQNDEGPQALSELAVLDADDGDILDR